MFVYTPDPNTPSIIGGGIMRLTRPCLSMEIACLFTDLLITGTLQLKELSMKLLSMNKQCVHYLCSEDWAITM